MSPKVLIAWSLKRFIRIRWIDWGRGLTNFIPVFRRSAKMKVKLWNFSWFTFILTNVKIAPQVIGYIICFICWFPSICDDEKSLLDLVGALTSTWCPTSRAYKTCARSTTASRPVVCSAKKKFNFERRTSTTGPWSLPDAASEMIQRCLNIRPWYATMIPYLMQALLSLGVVGCKLQAQIPSAL